jgi:hypothetical protein
VSAGVDRVDQLRLGLGSPGKDRAGNRPIHHLFPEAAAPRHVVDRGAEPRAIFPHQRGELSDPLRQDRLDALAQSPRQDWCSPAGPDRDHHIAAIDDRRNDEGGKIGAIDHVDRDACGPGARGDVVVERPSGRRDDGDGVGKIGGARIIGVDDDALAAAGRNRLGAQDVVAGEPAQARPGGIEQAQLVERRLARADQHQGSGREVEKDGEKSHRILYPAAAKIVFLYRSFNRPTKRMLFY